MSQLPLFLYAEDESEIRALFAAQTDLHTAWNWRIQAKPRFNSACTSPPHSDSNDVAQFLWGILSQHGQRARMLEQTVVTDQSMKAVYGSVAN